MSNNDPSSPVPPRRSAGDFPPEVLRLYDAYVHGGIDRRGFLEGASKFAVGGRHRRRRCWRRCRRASRWRSRCSRSDSRVKTESVDFDSPQGYGKGRGYVARPASAGRTRCRWCWWCTRTAASTRTSRTSRAASRSTTSSPSRPTRCIRSAATPATRTRRARCSAGSTRRRRARTSSPRRGVKRTLPGGNGQARRGRLLLRRRHGQHARPARARAAAGVPFYGSAPPLGEVGAIKAQAAPPSSPTATSASTPPGRPTRRR